jgi:hypothetical protein
MIADKVEEADAPSSSSIQKYNIILLLSSIHITQQQYSIAYPPCSYHKFCLLHMRHEDATDPLSCL